MNQRLPLLVALSAAFWISSCEKNPAGPVDANRDAPFLASVSVTPDSANLDNLVPAAGLYTLPVTLSASITDPRGPSAITQATYQVFAPGSGDPIASGPLLLAPGSGDTSGTYTASFPLQVARSGTGLYSVAFGVTGASGLPGNSVLRRLVVTKNAPPLIGPPAYRKGAGAGSDSTLVFWTVTVTDSNGYQSIGAVSFRAMNAADTAGHLMYDDGSPAHNDAFAGDGIYSAAPVWVKPTATLNDVQFEFRATDNLGRQAQPVIRTLQNHPPHIVSVDVPTSITRPTGSSKTNVFFHVTVADSDGLADIDSVYFENVSATEPTPFVMYDNGDFSDYGDNVAGDGIYSLIVQVDATNTPGNKEFHFFVVDRAGATDEAVRIITIK